MGRGDKFPDAGGLAGLVGLVVIRRKLPVADLFVGKTYSKDILRRDIEPVLRVAGHSLNYLFKRGRAYIHIKAIVLQALIQMDILLRQGHALADLDRKAAVRTIPDFAAYGPEREPVVNRLAGEGLQFFPTHSEEEGWLPEAPDSVIEAMLDSLVKDQETGTEIEVAVA